MARRINPFRIDNTGRASQGHFGGVFPRNATGRIGPLGRHGNVAQAPGFLLGNCSRRRGERGTGGGGMRGRGGGGRNSDSPRKPRKLHPEKTAAQKGANQRRASSLSPLRPPPPTSTHLQPKETRLSGQNKSWQIIQNAHRY